jgi:hypothetical protein
VKEVSMLNKFYSERPAHKMTLDDITQILSVYLNSLLEVAHKGAPSKNDVVIGKFL